MSHIKNILINCSNIIRDNPYNNFRNTYNYIKNEKNILNINKYKTIFENKEIIEINKLNYSKIKLCDSYINKKFNYKLELYLIKWNPKSNSNIHSHLYHGCVMKILEGCLIESIYNKDIILKQNNNYKCHDTGFINNDIGYHKIFNNTNNYSYSLHLYCDILNKHTEIKYFEAS